MNNCPQISIENSANGCIEKWKDYSVLMYIPHIQYACVKNFSCNIRTYIKC